MQDRESRQGTIRVFEGGPEGDEVCEERVRIIRIGCGPLELRRAVEVAMPQDEAAVQGPRGWSVHHKRGSFC